MSYFIGAASLTIIFFLTMLGVRRVIRERKSCENVTAQLSRIGRARPRPSTTADSASPEYGSGRILTDFEKNALKFWPVYLPQGIMRKDTTKVM